MRNNTHNKGGRGHRLIITITAAQTFPRPVVIRAPVVIPAQAGIQP